MVTERNMSGISYCLLLQNLSSAFRPNRRIAAIYRDFVLLATIRIGADINLILKRTRSNAHRARIPDTRMSILRRHSNRVRQA